MDRLHGEETRAPAPLATRSDRARWGMAALAIGLTLATVYARAALARWFGEGNALILCVLPILLSAYAGGLRVGLASTAAAAVGANYWVMRPLHAFGFESSADILQWATLVIVGVLISVLTESLRQTGAAERRGPALATGNSTERKVQVGFGFALTFLAVIGAASVVGVGRLREDTGWTTHTESVIAALRLLLSIVTDAETSERGYVLTGDSGYLAPYADAQRTIDAELQRLRRLTEDNDEQQRQLDLLAPVIAERMGVGERTVALRGSQGFVAAQAAIESGTGKQLHDRIRDLIGQLEDTEQGLLTARQDRAQRVGTITLVVIVGGGALAFVFVAVALFVMHGEFAVRRGAEASLLQARDQLEDRVRERTAALEQANSFLRDSGTRYRDTLDSMMEGCSLVGHDWRYLYVNDTAASHARQPQGRPRRPDRPGLSSRYRSEPLFANLQRCMDERTGDRQSSRK